jgi:CDP-diacylglycerol--glycerol-3-phosphate 3-phosphatidyltransferase
MKLRLPDILTFSRIIMAGVLLAVFELSIPFGKSLAFLIFVVAGVTDFLDGWLARNRYGVSSFGQLMDPLADKIMVCAVFVSFAALRLPTQSTSLVPAWIVVIIISREFLVTGLRLLAASRGKVISAGRWGKHKTVWQIVAAVLLLLGLAARYDLFRTADADFLRRYDFAFDYIAFAIGLAVAMITVASGAIYFMQHKELIGRHMER